MYLLRSIDIGGVNENLPMKEQKGLPYKLLDRQEQKNALSFLSDHEWQPAYWLIDKEIVSNFASKGKTSSLIAINKRMLSSLTSYKKLNLILDTTNSLSGNSLLPDDLLSILADDIIYSLPEPD